MYPIYRDLAPAVPVPTLLLTSDLWNSKEMDTEKIVDYCNRTRSAAYNCVFRSTRHFNFTDVPLLLHSPLSRVWAVLQSLLTASGLFGKAESGGRDESGVVLLQRWLCEGDDTFPMLGAGDGRRVLSACAELIVSGLKQHLQPNSNERLSAAIERYERQT
jgi:hypothetical protein